MMRVYADYNASAPLRPEARAALVEAAGWAGNPSSGHRDGARIRRALERARAEVAALVAARPSQVVFTSGATEANTLALAGSLEPGDRLVTSAIEHASVLETAAGLEQRGVSVVRVGVDHEGCLDLDQLAEALSVRARLVSLGLANAEVGSLLPDAAVDLARDAGVLLHLDAAQAIGRIPVDASRASLLAISGHKLGAPAGVGALVVCGRAVPTPIQRGGPQERGRRAGTENVVGIVALGAAAAAVRRDAMTEAARLRALRETLWRELRAAIADVQRNGPALAATLPNTLNVTVPGVSGEALLVRLDLAGVSVSLGSACAAGSPEPSHVLLAMGRSEAEARAGLRISLGHATTAADVDRIGAALVGAVREVRAAA